MVYHGIHLFNQEVHMFLEACLQPLMRFLRENIQRWAQSHGKRSPAEIPPTQANIQACACSMFIFIEGSIIQAIYVGSNDDTFHLQGVEHILCHKQNE